MSEGDTGRKRPGKLSALLSSGRLDGLLETGGVRMGGAESKAAPTPRPPEPSASASLATSAELARVTKRDERLRTSGPRFGGVTPTPLEEVVASLPEPAELERRTREHGRLTTLTWRHPLDASHGPYRHADALRMPTTDLAAVARDARLGAFDVRRALFLDIESTGLSHGAGTYAFLVGLAWFEGDELVVQELFLEDPNDEAAMLDHLAELRREREFLVSFNGRCYDVHVLQSRLILNRVYDEPTSTLQLTPHVDLLHLARPIHGGRFADTRLQTLEREILGFQRHGDVPGELIPSLYFSYLQTSDAAPLAPVFRHNAWDVVSMVSLLTHLCAVLRSDGEGMGADIAANLGHLWLSRRQPERAARVLARVTRKLSETGLAPQTRDRALADRCKALKRVLKEAKPDRRRGLALDLAETLSLFSKLRPRDHAPHIELSRVHERYLGDPVAAHRHALAAQNLLPRTATAAERAREERRVARLARRAGAAR